MTSSSPGKSLADGFLEAATRFPARPALRVAGETLSYRVLRDRAAGLAATIQAYPEFSNPKLTAVFAHRSPTAFVGVLGALLSGNGYVPLNRTFPADRTRLMLKLSGCRTIVVDRESLTQLDDVLRTAEMSLLILVPELEDVSDVRERLKGHIVVGAHDLRLAAGWKQCSANLTEGAYLLFTSGSTGIPKGVLVSHLNVRSFIDYVVNRYEITERDRLSQLFDMTFDLSVFDMFAAWERGALVCCPAEKALINPARFVREEELTVWFSVPSTASFMKRLGMLKSNHYPSLRWSLFCGEPLPVTIAASWSEAAPNSVVENLYGPTELTIACTHYRWDGARSPAESELGIVPIGSVFPGMESLVVSEDLKEVSPGEIGELLMRGSQMTQGYLNDEARTRAAFITPPGQRDVYYRTGDRVRRSVQSGPLLHLGRMDSQIKIRGHRVELGEIEAAVRSAVGLEGVVAIPWPITDEGCAGVEVFVEGDTQDVDSLRHVVGELLPDYMVPRRFHFVESLPLNVNGKFDRAAMSAWLMESQ